MSYICPAPQALTTVSRLKEAGFGRSPSNDSLQMAINAISEMVVRRCGRSFRLRTFGEGGDAPAEILPGTGRRVLLLSTYPIRSVSKVLVDGREIDDWALLPGQEDWGALYRRLGWPRREGPWGALVCDPDGQPFYNIEVSYTGGFAQVPADLELAVMQEVDILTGGTSARRVRSERTPGGWSVSYGDQEHECSFSSVQVFRDYTRIEV